MTDLALLRTLTEASAKLQEAYRDAKRSGKPEVASMIFAASQRVSVAIGEVVTSRPATEVES